MTDDLESLLAQLQQSPTDLRRLVASLLYRPRSLAWVPRRAIDGWSSRDPIGWARVQGWLADRNVRVVPI
jgi:hypothetical protein